MTRQGIHKKVIFFRIKRIPIINNPTDTKTDLILINKDNESPLLGFLIIQIVHNRLNNIIK